MMMTSRTTSCEHLTEDIKFDLVRKIVSFLQRIAHEPNKVFIFTDTVDLWKRKSPSGQDTIIRTEYPLPPIPPGYHRRLGYDIVNEMNWFVGEYTARQEYDIDWNLYDTAEGDEIPQVHLLFAKDHLEPPWLFLKKAPKVPKVPTTLPLSAAQTSSTGGGDQIQSPTLSIGKELYRFLSLTTLSERSSVEDSAASSSQASSRRVTRSSSIVSSQSTSSAEHYEDALDVLPESTSSATEDDPTD